MSALDVAQRYFDAWNESEAGLRVATFDPDATYGDAATQGPRRAVWVAPSVAP